ncbi:oligosaccharide 1,2-alpha-mannosidase [Seminavis robusta]|uniref:alpha-1,2-Mannosidase n=1 Tax=Seminavis robusta TaxID=568900 RepID=A0A9N8EMM0_9STRA|nr:oligosaccharide 1,2-alpha-mannosidase [Seminavis robusta]|eukprot:Sro1375_g267330.1 oligosaccharide 1,2-alpha-mannosidase (621) ;mRNA; r:6901-9003
MAAKNLKNRKGTKSKGGNNTLRILLLAGTFVVFCVLFTLLGGIRDAVNKQAQQQGIRQAQQRAPVHGERLPYSRLQQQRMEPPNTQQIPKAQMPPPGQVGGPYPYPLDPPPAGYDIHRDYEPKGGSRFGEYTQGDAPYVITEEIRQKSDDLARVRREYVKNMMKTAWQGYVDHAFGMDEIKPASGTGDNGWGGFGVTLVDTLDTLWLTGMKDEFWQARDWVRDHLMHGKPHQVSVFETTIRSLGGLLSAYDWSGDKVFLNSALDLGKRLSRAFDGSTTGIPFGQVNLQSGHHANIAWAGGSAILSEFGSMQLEYRMLDQCLKTDETGTMRYKTEHIFELMHQISPPNGLFPYFVSNNDPSGRPSFRNDHLTFGAMADSFYEYMLKVWIQGGKVEPMYRDMYDKAMQGMHDELVKRSDPSGLLFLADKMNGNRYDDKMDHLVCFMGGLLALGAYTDPLGLDSRRAQRDLKTGRALTYTCYQMYARMETGISAEFVQFYPGQDFKIGSGAPHYLLRPETVESFFILSQLTGDPVYREWGWEVFQSIEKYCRTGVGYGTLSTVRSKTDKPRDKMETFFLAETVKYMYLLQDPDTEVDVLHKHVFNTEAHPMRVFNVMDPAAFH